MVKAVLGFFLEFMEGFVGMFILGTIIIYIYRLLQVRKKDVWYIRLRDGKGTKINLR
jgi:hypothetical protein